VRWREKALDLVTYVIALLAGVVRSGVAKRRVRR